MLPSPKLYIPFVFYFLNKTLITLSMEKKTPKTPPTKEEEKEVNCEDFPGSENNS